MRAVEERRKKHEEAAEAAAQKDNPQSREPSTLPDADAAQSRDPSTLPDADAVDPANEEADYDADEGGSAEVIVTPLLDADAVVDLMVGGIPSHDIGWRAEKIRAGVDLVFPEVIHDGVNDEDMVLGAEEARVFCASGESDTESIRDFDSGDGRFRFSQT